MKRLHIYLSMYEILNTNKRLYKLEGLDGFLENANPFQMNDENSISSKFIELYDSYFTTHCEDEEESYHFILSFLNEVNEKEVIEAFKLSSLSQWSESQSRIIN